jgi:hypothetical protein
MLFGPLRFVGCPKNGKTFFRKTQMCVLGTSAQTGAPNGAFWAPNGAFWAISPLGDFSSPQRMEHAHTIYGLAHLVPKKFRKLPSAARFSPKVFRRSHFWTSILVHFLKIFSSLVQSHFEI